MIDYIDLGLDDKMDWASDWNKYPAIYCANVIQAALEELGCVLKDITAANIISIKYFQISGTKNTITIRDIDDNNIIVEVNNKSIGKFNPNDPDRIVDKLLKEIIGLI